MSFGLSKAILDRGERRSNKRPAPGRLSRWALSLAPGLDYHPVPR
jgi:hypothetical protein